MCGADDALTGTGEDVGDAEVRSCVLLAAPVTLDGRVQRITRTLSELGPVDLMAVGGSDSDGDLFDERVKVIPTVRPPLRGRRKWLLLHRHNDQLAAAALARGTRFDLVWANDYDTLWPALQIARATGARVVYDSHEIWLETVNQFFPRDAPLFKRVAFKVIVELCRLIGNRLEPRFARQADAVVTANESFAEVLSSRLGRSDVGVILNCPERRPLERSNRLRKELGLGDEQQIVLYQGMMNPGRGLSELVESARYLQSDVRLVLLGGGMLLPSLRQRAKELNLEDRVLFPGPVAQAELHQWTESSDLGVLVLDPINLSKRLALANKIFEYMGAGVPILATDLPENRRILDRCDCGWLISDWSPPSLAAHIMRLLAQPDERRRRAANGRRWVEERYNWEVESAKVIDTVRPLLRQQGVRT